MLLHLGERQNLGSVRVVEEGEEEGRRRWARPPSVCVDDELEVAWREERWKV